MQHGMRVAAWTLPFFCVAAAFGQPADTVSHWRAEASLDDSVGSNLLDPVGMVDFANGGTGLGFDLLVSSLQLNDPIGGGLANTQQFTVAAWIKQRSYGFTASVVNERPAINDSGFTVENLFNTPGTIAFAVNIGGTFYMISAPGWELNRFDHVACTFDAATHSMVLYRNGDVVASRSDLPAGGMTTSPQFEFRIGRNIANAGNWDGVIDDIYYIARAISQSEVQSLITPCPGDFDGDRDIDLGDLGVVLAAFRISDAGDLDGDHDTDLSDLGILLSAYGQPCP